MYTELPETRQGPALVLTLEETHDFTLDIPENETAKESGGDSILRPWSRYKKNSTITKYQVLGRIWNV